MADTIGCSNESVAIMTNVVGFFTRLCFHFNDQKHGYFKSWYPVATVLAAFIVACCLNWRKDKKELAVCVALQDILAIVAWPLCYLDWKPAADILSTDPYANLTNAVVGFAIILSVATVGLSIIALNEIYKFLKTERQVRDEITLEEQTRNNPNNKEE